MSRKIIELDAKDYPEAMRAIAEVVRELESKGGAAKDIHISYEKDNESGSEDRDI